MNHAKRDTNSYSVIQIKGEWMNKRNTLRMLQSNGTGLAPIRMAASKDYLFRRSSF
jgi:hypothetical protein